MTSSYRFATHCVHAGARADAHGAVRPPVYNSTTFTPVANSGAGPDPAALYTRYGRNPTLYRVEHQLAALEDAEAGILFSAGMAALSSACLALGGGGIVGLGNLYGGTDELLTEQLPRLGYHTRLLIPDEMDRLDAVLAEGAGLVIVESPTNPDLAVQDLAALAEQVHARGARLLVDNTFATPVNQRPLALGADMVVHSATKYLGGHSDLTAGAALGSAELIRELDDWRRQLGQTPSPETADLLGRSLATLELRMQRHNANALYLAQRLAEHPAVARVHYPGLTTAPDHAVAARQMDGFGGMLAFDIHGDLDTASGVLDRLALFVNAPSLGGVESLATQPTLTSHGGITREQRHRRGIDDGLIRLSVGIEDPLDLLDDLCAALEAVDNN